MKCSNCGGELIFNEGVGVCGSCGSKHSAQSVFEKTEVYICYIENDDNGKRTKDSVIANEVYKKLESKNINSFYERVSVANAIGEELEMLRHNAFYNAKIIVFVGANSENFEVLYEKHKEQLANKKIIPIISEMKAEQLPDALKGFQASNFDALGALDDLSVSVLNILGRGDEVELEILYQKSVKKKKILITSLISLAVAFVCAAVVLLAVFLGKDDEQQVLTNSDIYNNAVQLLNEEKYLEAASEFNKILDYKDSSTQVNKIYDRYDGYYKNNEQNCSLYLNISDANQAEVIFEKYVNGKNLKIEESIFLKENEIKGSFIDNQSNKGNISILLYNDKIEIYITSNKENNNLSIGNLNLQFFLKDKTDNEEVKSVSKDMLHNWLTNLTSKDDIINAGFDLEEKYEDEVNGVICFNMEGKIFKIQNTNIILLMADAEQLVYNKCNINNDATGYYVVGVLAPASMICPEKIGKNMGAYYESDLLYFPCDKEFKDLYYKEGAQYAFYSGPGFFQNTVTTVENDSFIGAFSSKIIGKENYNINKKGLTERFYEAIALTEFNKQNNEDGDSWVSVVVEGETNNSALVCVTVTEFHEGTTKYKLFYYKVDKAKQKAVLLEGEELEKVKQEIKSKN